MFTVWSGFSAAQQSPGQRSDCSPAQFSAALWSSTQRAQRIEATVQPSKSRSGAKQQAAERSDTAAERNYSGAERAQQEQRDQPAAQRSPVEPNAGQLIEHTS